jgi:2-polyprenyl-6-methoxyphenol hydroxylase-like FAD-dependent oxidoreductase
MSERNHDAIVIGAGVGGAALALALSHAGLRVLLVERRSGPGNINRGDSLLPAVTRLLAGWGALERIRAAGATPLERMRVIHPTRGLLMEAPLADPAGNPYLVLPHPEIERALTEEARATGRVDVRYRTRLIGLVESEGRVIGVDLVDREGKGAREIARLVIGADGASSQVREGLGIELALAPYPAGYFIIDFERPPDFEEAMNLYIHRDGGVMVVPQRPGVAGTAVLVHPRENDLFRAGTLEDKVAAIRARCPALASATPLPRHAHLYALSRGHAPRYFARGAALMGDAVHVTNPTAGQGMTMAIEDAAALARHAVPAIAAGADHRAVDAALVAYQRERRPINAGLLRWSHFMGKFFAMHSAIGSELRARVFALGGHGIGQWIQRRVWNRVATRPDPAPSPARPSLAMEAQP